ncbi:MAG: response regulator transcription factor [Acidimicrobiaceae bacterium]|nr:response regulator transcription factor [Acidimicrobiaceae bacterium]
MNISADKESILAVDDNPAITELIQQGLSLIGYHVEVASSGKEALFRATTSKFALVILDLMMPDLDGFQVIERLRKSGRDVPVLFLTARNETQDKITGLSLGADDYITKPFSLEELAERVKAVLRRYKGTAVAGINTRLQFGDLVLDESMHQVRRGEVEIDLTPTEFNLLAYLMENSNVVVSKAQILSKVWGYDFDGSDGVVESYVSFLRRKIDFTEPQLLHTIRGIGYSLRLPR